MSKPTARNTRALAATTVARVMAGDSLNHCLQTAISQCAPESRGLLQELCYGTLRLSPLLDAVMQQMLNKPLKAKDNDVRALILMGLYQLHAMRIPPHAAVSETVAATRALKKHWAKGMCNALLRRFQRDADALLDGVSSAERNAHPRWLFDALHSQWPEQAGTIVAANNERPPMTLRINPQQTSRDAYLQLLSDHDIAASPGVVSAAAVRLEDPCDVELLPEFDSGYCSVQDEAAQCAAELLDAQPGEYILDACAAPGGKTCHIAECTPGLEALVAMDVDADRLLKVQENAERLQLAVDCRQGNAAQPDDTLDGMTFDRILVDAPCSATGVIRRHPDVKILRRSSDARGFAAQQLAILQGLWPRLRDGGVLLYATCSVLKEENDDTVQAFLGSQPEASIETISRNGGYNTEHGWQLLPDPNGTDGLYYARLRKTRA
ncbi:16S rRNA (cytosine(967)-C(5))-methyltransferase RsmB [Parahalioglobus pacificus]|uniref:16S rRNA (cytosine(967)-C(5))-methyltransferase n=1 Tax=Parahalioglobus pacificus TaxID=930806 RepID=A0A918XJD3_9GAMM|nr:16S rRNA (cytosine(967)-C(5))-methyltransferase RsmB [Halioglobus pacificus]GHD34640.1 ribosomal RNA small subunit methyltransferase B [Halioglobus pacificus]